MLRAPAHRPLLAAHPAHRLPPGSTAPINCAGVRARAPGLRQHACDGHRLWQAL